MYDYIILPGIIQVTLDGTNDPIMVDILSEIDNARGRIYADGTYYDFLNYKIHHQDSQAYLDLEVIEIN